MRKWIAAIASCMMIAGCTVQKTEPPAPKEVPPVADVHGTKMVTKTEGGQYLRFDKGEWKPVFWKGVNLGVTLPGHAPGELVPSREDYERWLNQMDELGANVIRLYTIMPPYFYDVLREHNEKPGRDLYIIQGIWIPEDTVLQKGDFWDKEVVQQAKDEIRNAALAVYGDGTIPIVRGHAGGAYRSDVSPWLAGWQYGIEWDPYLVMETSKRNAGKSVVGQWFAAKAGASPFESWLADMLDTIAKEEKKRGFQHPIGFTNWVTTDPLVHPAEPLQGEDMIAVDPVHIAPQPAYQAGYFASYHVYPYYPDFLRLTPAYQTYRDSSGQVNPYAGYLHELKAHHKNMPILVTEYGVPSSRGIAHYGPFNQNQGMHTEQEQGKIDAALYHSIRDEGYNGAVLFAWQDEWFKITWNTDDLEKPRERMPLWRNVLNNEQNFGLIAMEAGRKEDAIYLDGKLEDWEKTTHRVQTQTFGDMTARFTSDEAYVYMALTAKQPWEKQKGTVFGLNTVQNSGTGQARMEFLFSFQGREGSEWLVNRLYDMNPLVFRVNPDKPDAFVPFRQVLNRERVHAKTGQRYAAETYPTGKMKFGVTDPGASGFSNLADFYYKDNVLELRIPWQMAGFSDPSSGQVWLYPKAGEKKPAFGSISSFEIALYENGQERGHMNVPVTGWEEATYHERKKESFTIMQDAFREE